MPSSRRHVLHLAGGSLAAAAVFSPSHSLWAQVQEEAENEPVTIVPQDRPWRGRAADLFKNLANG